MKKKSFEEKVGRDTAARLIEFFLQNETFKRPTLGEIVGLIPEAKFTIGRLAGIRRDHEREIKTLKTAYLVQFAKVPPVGTSNIPEIDEAYIINAALAEWKPGDKRFKTGAAYAAMKVNQARIAAGIKKMTNADEVQDTLRTRLRQKKK